MVNTIKLFGSLAVLVGFLVASTVSASAAAPDGAGGPWADSIVSSAQGLTKAGNPVLVTRSDTSQALGIAESTGADYDPAIGNHFWSAGFGGSIVLGFDNSIVNGPGPDLKVFEVTVGPVYPDEKLKIEASKDGITWNTLVESAARDEEVDLGHLKCAQYVRITDTSVAAEFEDTADGYDLDGAQALNFSEKKCKPNRWKGDTENEGFCKNRPDIEWEGYTFINNPQGDPCKKLQNEALAFHFNWETNSQYNGVYFRDTYFDSHGFSPLDDQTTENLHDQAHTLLLACNSPDKPDEDTVKTLKKVLNWINNGKFLWY